MQREIFEVRAIIIDANGTYNPIQGYPKIFDSHNASYADDIEKTRRRAYAELSDVKSAFLKRDDRQVQIAQITRLSDGLVMEAFCDGHLTSLPDPELEEEE